MPNTNDPAVDVRDVHRSFAGKPALAGLSIQAPPGSITVLLGPNGAGKTTAIRVITGALGPHQGTVRTFGVDPAVHGEAVRRRCGVVSAKPALYDRLSGRDNLRYSASLYGLDPARAPIEEAAGRFGIASALDRAVGGYSTGMKTRLALARSVLHEPDLLLLDEPTSGLDPESSVAVLGLIRELADGGRTVVLCTHLLAEAEGLADNVVVVEQGRSVVQGPPDDLMRRWWPDAQVHLAVDTAADVAAALRDHHGVRTARARGDGRWEVALDDLALVPTVVDRLVAARVAVREVRPFRPTLEDLYFAARGLERGAMVAVEEAAQ